MNGDQSLNKYIVHNTKMDSVREASFLASINSNPIVKLNLCGKIFEVEKNILMGSELFQTMFADCPTDDSVIRINRSALIFEHVLAYLVDSSYPYPREYANELKYYLIPHTFAKLYYSFDTLEQKIVGLEKKIESLESNVERIKISNGSNETCCHANCYEDVCISVACREHAGKCSYSGYECYSECKGDEEYCTYHRD